MLKKCYFVFSLMAGSAIAQTVPVSPAALLSLPAAS